MADTGEPPALPWCLIGAVCAWPCRWCVTPVLVAPTLPFTSLLWPGTKPTTQSKLKGVKPVTEECTAGSRCSVGAGRGYPLPPASAGLWVALFLGSTCPIPPAVSTPHPLSLATPQNVPTLLLVCRQNTRACPHWNTWGQGPQLSLTMWPGPYSSALLSTGGGLLRVSVHTHYPGQLGRQVWVGWKPAFL